MSTNAALAIPTSLFIAYVLAALIGYAGYRAKALTWDGAVAACAVGGTVFGFGGLDCAALLVIFFASSSLLSFVGTGNRRKQRAAEIFEKGGRRDAAQVLANGGVAALLALLIGVLGGNDATPVLFGALVGVFAAATADTWATEIGVLNRGEPHLITTGKVVEVGTSGGVTWLGSGAALLGASIIGLVAALLALSPLFAIPSIRLVPLVAAGLMGGLAGMLADSLLGATIQASYRCPRCDKPTESRIHKCGTPTQLQRGWAWVNNDMVNVAGTVAGALVGGAIMLL